MAILTYVILVTAAANCVWAQNAEKLPQITSPVQNEVSFREGKNDEPLILECVATGSTAYRWTKNGKPFDTTKSDVQLKEGTLTFAKPSKSDEGVYECLAENQLGVASSGPIDVKMLYVVTPEPTTQKFTPTYADPFKFDCKIPEGYPKPLIEWVLENDSGKKTFLERTVTLDPEGTLWFSNFTDNDVRKGYKYVCLASTPAVSEKIRVTEVIIEGIKERTEPRNGDLIPQYLSEDMTVLTEKVVGIYCIYGGTPLVAPDWFKNGKDTNNKPGDRITRHNRTFGKRLLIKNTEIGDTGKYTCEIDNGVGNKQTHSMQLTVQSKPKFAVNPQRDINSDAGKDVIVPCTVESVPASTITFTRNGKPISQDAQHVIQNNGLLIKNVQKRNTGNYGCKATNEHGVIYAETSLYVQ